MRIQMCKGEKWNKQERKFHLQILCGTHASLGMPTLLLTIFNSEKKKEIEFCY